jgi:peroxiredoxin family protein
MSDNIAVMISTCDTQRLWSALSLVAAQAARGLQVAVFFSGDAARITHQNFIFPHDRHYQEKGVTTPGQLIDSCLELSVAFTVCQTGMHLCDVTSDQLRPGMTAGGLLAWLSEQKNSTLLFA